MEKFEMIVESIVNGQRSQAISQFRKLKREERIKMLTILSDNEYQESDTDRLADQPRAHSCMKILLPEIY